MKPHHPRFFALASALLLLVVNGAGQTTSKTAQREVLVYAGTFTAAGPSGSSTGSKGIYVFRFRPATGTLSRPEVAAETDNPSFLAVDLTNHFLYSVNNVMNYEGKGTGSVSLFAIDAETGKLKFLNRVSSRGPGATHVSVDRTGHTVLVANYQGGSVASFPIRPDGSLGEAASFFQHTGSSVDGRQTGPHAHAMMVSPDNRFVFTPELGLDKVMSYHLDPVIAVLTPNDPPFVTVSPGSGPRHLAFHPNGRFVFVVNEIGSTVTAFTYNKEPGILNPIQTISTLPEGFTGANAAAEIFVDPTGKFLYASNRGHDSIAVFGIDQEKGTIKAVERIITTGKMPRYFGFDPTGQYVLVAHQNSGNVLVFKFDRTTGCLTPTGASIDVPSPVCLVFSPRH